MIEAEKALVEELHIAFGLRCDWSASEGAYQLVTSTNAPDRSITPIDRYNIVGAHRTYDGVHPTLGAQYAIGQLLVNHLC